MNNDTENNGEQAREYCCEHKDQCQELLAKIIDGAATPEEIMAMQSKFETCLPCYKHYSLDMAIKEVMKNKIEKKPVPESLVAGIRELIKDPIPINQDK